MSAGQDPCPCGSGAPYADCCGPRELVLAARAPAWQADIVPLPAGLCADSTVRPCAALIVTGRHVLHTETVFNPSPESEAMAEDLAREIGSLVARLGLAPRALRVRWPEVAPLVAARLAATGIAAPVRSGALRALDRAAFDLRAHLGGRRAPERVLAGSAPTWRAWGLGQQLCAELFRRAAAFHRAAPWEALRGVEFFAMTGPSGRRWTLHVCVHGPPFGLSLYSDPADLASVARAGGPAIGSRRGREVSLVLLEGAELQREARREIAAAGWEVAAAAAYPSILTINTPAGGLTRDDATDLAEALGAVAELVADRRRATSGAAARPEAGTRLQVVPHPATGAPRAALVPGGAEGPSARPEAAVDPSLVGDLEELELRQWAFARRFAEHLAAQGLTRRTIEGHRWHVDTFLDFLTAVRRVPLLAVHEMDLRLFLYERYPRLGGEGERQIRALPGSLKRFFDYLAAEEGLVLPAAGRLLADREAFYDACRGYPWEGTPDDARAWRIQAWMELVRRQLTYPDAILHALADEDDDGRSAFDARLAAEAGRRWLLWRDELIRAGTDRPAALEAALTQRLEHWYDTPHPELAGKTPREVLIAERQHPPEPPPTKLQDA